MMVRHAHNVTVKIIIFKKIIHVFAIKPIILLMMEVSVFVNLDIMKELESASNVLWDAQNAKVQLNVQLVILINQSEMIFVNVKLENILMIMTYVSNAQVQLIIVLNVILQVIA